MFDLMFSIVPIIILAVFAFIIYTFISNWKYNKSQPRVASEATVITKRTHYQSNHSSDNFHHNTSLYYLTFEFSTGDRKEFSVNASEYGLLRENDKGILTFQGNEFISFQRK